MRKKGKIYTAELKANKDIAEIVFPQKR